jgi:multiple sugar transport system ATP-binding protein
VQTRTEISKLHQRLQTTFIYVTHDQMEAMTMGTRIAVLKDGLLHQLDTPQNLYDHPANIFVAGFIGSPAMNFFNTRATGTVEDCYIEGHGFKLHVPPAQALALRDHLGQDVVFGVRPEDIHDRQYVPSGITADYAAATVDVAELMGSEVFLYLVSEGKTFVARVDPRTSGRVGNKLDIAFNMDKAHFFDAKTEKALA